ncbi:hypothetical protein AB0J38_25140 [Streptomyces sp. NPDC050095]|uniref:hypothetical protein n=1 Tax=unclassified Streptomyces TaxID=2593676 RepID=UPI00343C8346
MTEVPTDEVAIVAEHLVRHFGKPLDTLRRQARNAPRTELLPHAIGWFERLEKAHRTVFQLTEELAGLLGETPGILTPEQKGAARRLNKAITQRDAHIATLTFLLQQPPAHAARMVSARAAGPAATAPRTAPRTRR